MTLGTNNKKSVYALVVLGVFAAYMVYSNLLAGPDIPAASAGTPAAAVAPAVPIPATGGLPVAQTAPRTRARSEEFHPALRRKRDDGKALEPDKVDPTLRTDLLKKVQSVELAGAVGSRNLFQFGAPPVVAKAELPKGPETKVPIKYGPNPPPPPPPPPPPRPDPPPPPIPLKYYAFWVSKENGKRTACFMDNEEIVMAGEGETVKRRYRVIRINPTSVVMEDLDVKKQQTLQLTEEVQG